MADSSSDTQHDRLRKRLEAELQTLKNMSDTIDYDWFLRGRILARSDNSNDVKRQDTTESDPLPHLQKTNTPVSPLMSPSMVNSPNSKAAPSVSTSKDESELHSMANLSRVKTADARLLSTPITGTCSNSSFGIPLKKTATNIDATDIGVSRNIKKPTMSRSNQTPIPPPSQAKKKGFFKKLFGSKSDDPKPEINIFKSEMPKSSTSPASSTLKSPISSIKTSPPPSRASSIKTNAPPTPLSPHKSKDESCNSFDSYEQTPSSAPISEQYKDIDPQLSAYLKEIESSTDNILHNSTTLEHDYNYIYSPVGLDSIHYEANVIPPHPDKPKLPSAFATKPKFGGSVEKELFLKQKKEREEREKELSVFGSLLHRTKTNTNQTGAYLTPLNESEDMPPITFKPIQYVPPPKKTSVTCPIESLKTVKPLKKVAFATTTFVNDPPQQIPSRKPRKGNVEICPNGELIIHKIDPQEKINSATGIVVGGSGHLKLINENAASDPNNKNLNIDGIPSSATMKKTASSTSVASQGSFDQTIKNEDKIAAAQKARETKTGEEIDVQKEHLTIDKPMVKRKKQMAKPVVTLKMDELYTRCCHLREILPIPASLKQIPKGSTDPIPLLHLRNPRPSMIEILSFTDFIRIAPVICVSFDGVSLTNEMFRIVLSSLLYKKYLEKLSLRNTPIDEEGWRMLCAFLSMNKSLKKLDVTQCPSLDVNTQRMKKKTTKAQDTRMTCNMNDRSDRNWALFTAALIFRGGIEDLILTGCKVPDLRLFSDLLNLALVRTKKIGLAYNNLSLQHCYVIARWLEDNQEIIGIDLGYNDLSSFLKPFIDYAKSLNNRGNNLRMLSLNSCNLINSKEAEEFFNSLSTLPKLTYLDISCNPKLMISFLSKLSIHLPLFHSLVVLYIDDNNLDTPAMVRILESISLTPNLSILSIFGNEMNDIVAEALCTALRSSETLYSISFDIEKVSLRYQRKIGLLTMRNVERQLYARTGEINGVTKSFADIISVADKDQIRKELGLEDHMSFTETFYNLIHNRDKFDKEQYEKFTSIIVKVRSNLKNTIQELTKLHSENKLSVQGTEMLFRLLSMDASIDKAFELFHSDTLDSIKDQHEGDTSKIKDVYNIRLKHENQSNEGTDSGEATKFESLMKNIKMNPFENPAALKKCILGAKDPYDLITMLKQCSKHNITMKDLFLKSQKENDEEEEDDEVQEFSEDLLEASQGSESDVSKLELGDARSSDTDTDIDTTNSNTNNNTTSDTSCLGKKKLQSIYDQILREFQKSQSH